MGERYFIRRIPRVNKSGNKGVILLSGGMDSAVTLYLARKYGYRLTALIFDYGQKHRKEIYCARRLARLNRLKYYVVSLKLPWAKSSLTQKTLRVPSHRDLKKKEIPSTYVSGRNIIFLSYAASLADSLRAKTIFIGAHIQDYSGYPDCRPEFLDNFEGCINSGLKEKGIKVVAPLVDKNKKEIIEIGVKLGVPFALTWSCYKGGRTPCGVCDSCRFRKNAFQELGLRDPLLEKVRR